jgi:hypothetical protein
MSPEMTEHAIDRDAKSPQTDSASKPTSPPVGQSFARRRRLLMGLLGVLALVLASVFGIPRIRSALSTVSTDDAYVNGHVTLLPASAARSPGCWLMTTTVCTKVIFLLNWTRSHFETQSQ